MLARDDDHLHHGVHLPDVLGHAQHRLSHPPPPTQVCIFPSYIIARIVRGAYMYHYRWVEEDDEDGRVRRGVLLICQPSVLTKKLMQYFSTSARVTDMGTVYLIRIYFVALASVTLVIIATLHCSYSFLVPFIFRIVYIDEYKLDAPSNSRVTPTLHLTPLTTYRPPYRYNWTLRFRLISVHLISFPFWLDTWWALRHIDAMLVDGHTVTQLYDMRSEKEERLAGGFPPEEEGMSLASALQGGDGRPDPTPARATVGGGGGGGLGGLGGGRGAGARELEQKLAEADLDRTLCKNRIAQLEEELEALREEKSEALTEAKLNNEFLSRGFADLSVLLESGFKQLERFYYETGGRGGGGDGEGEGAALMSAPAGGGGSPAAEQKKGGMKNAVEDTIANLRAENDVANERKTALQAALSALDDDEEGEGEGGEGDGGGDVEEGGGGALAKVSKWGAVGKAVTTATAVRRMSVGANATVTDDDGVMMTQAELVTKKLQEAKETKEELARTIRMRDELSRQVLQLEREAVVGADQIEKMNDDLAGVQAERDLLERKVNELRRELHSKNKEIEHIEAELKQSKSQQIRAMAKLSVQKSKAEKQLTQMKAQLGKLGEDKGALFKEVGSLEAQLAQAHADREEARNWASTYRDMLLKVA